MADTNTALVELREKFEAKQKTLLDTIELAGGQANPDFTRKSVQEKLGAVDEADARVKFLQVNSEAADLGKQLADANLRASMTEATARQEALTQPASQGGMVHIGANGEVKGWARQFVEAKGFKNSREKREAFSFPIDVRYRDLVAGTKALMTTAAGFAPESVRIGVNIEKATRPIQVLDLIPDSPTTQAAIPYMEETTRTHSAAETAEGTAYPESTFVWTPQSSTVRKIADSIPVTDEQLEDVDFIESLLEQRLTFGLRQRLDSQVLVGNGTAPNLRGINAVVGIQTRAKGADAEIEAFAKAMNDIRVTGRAIPNGAVFHPNDWLAVFLTKTTSGDYIFGNPFQGPGPTSLFGVTATQSDAQTENTVLVGDFVNFSRIYNRRGVRNEWGYVGTQFTEGEITLRADLRVAFVVFRPAAFIQITGM